MSATRPTVRAPDGLRWIDAGNAGPFTLEGTRTHIVGRRQAAVVDPGPPSDAHVEAVARALERGGAEQVTLLLTHGHGDHAGAAAALSARLGGAPVLGAWGGVRGEGQGSAPEAADDRPGAASGGFRPLADGERVPTDAGDLIALSTPGHAHEHLVFHWPDARAAFVGDLLLGTGDTTWVGEYPGCVADYLASLDRLEGLGADVLLPAHGPPLPDAAGAIARYRAHRLARIAQVARVLETHPAATVEELLARVYGTALVPPLAAAARASVTALAEHVRGKRR